MKQSDSFDQVAMETLVSQSANFLSKTSVSLFSLKDILVSPDNSKIAVTKYGNDLGLAGKNLGPKGGANAELAAFSNLMQSKDQGAKKTLVASAQNYNKLALSLAKITVPSNFSNNHLVLINSLAAISNAVSEMSEGLEDPLKSLRAVSNYIASYKNLTEVVRVMSVDMVQMGVSYKQGENGYYFFFGI